jgi:hypothetical protein
LGTFQFNFHLDFAPKENKRNAILSQLRVYVQFCKIFINFLPKGSLANVFSEGARGEPSNLA